MRRCRAILAGLLWLTAASGAAADGFHLRDDLGRTWRNEEVHFAASAQDIDGARAHHALIDSGGKPVLYQIVPGASGAAPAIAFLADLNPFQAESYRFTSSAAAPAKSDLIVRQSAQSVIVGNSLIGLSIRKQLAPGEGPIASIRLKSGAWIGASQLQSHDPVASYAVEVEADGPVFAEVICRLTFAGGQSWQMRFHVQAHEPVITVDETYALKDSATLSLALSPGFAPDRLFYRYGKTGADGREGMLATWPIPKSGEEPVFMLEPWLHWWEQQRQGTWFALYNDNSPDLLAIAALSPALWVEPDNLAQRFTAQTQLNAKNGTVAWSLPTERGARRWMIVALDKAAALAPLKNADLYRAPLPQQYQIKHGDFPLDMVKDDVLHWSGDEIGHPHLIVTKRDLARLHGKIPIDLNQLLRYTRAKIGPYDLNGPLSYFLSSADPTLGRHLAETAVRITQHVVDEFVHEDAWMSLGYAPHHRTELFAALNLADAIWSTPYLSPPLRERLKAQIAFLGYTVSRADFWSPARGFAANPNMTTAVAAMRAAIGYMLPTHPIAAAWAKRGTDELKRELDQWSDSDGGWLEAPSYAMLSYDYILGVFLMASNAGHPQYLDDPKIKKVIEWFAKIATPPDPALDNHRHNPPIGNTYMREPSGEYGTVAALFKEKNPEFAAHMQWMYRQEGSRTEPGIGGFFPIMAGYRTVLVDASIPAKPPHYASEWFPETGVLLRNGFASGHETQLYLIAGHNHAHYDKDSGSITLWAKGRLLADDFGYNGEMAGDYHSMLIAPGAPDGSLMTVAAFSTTPRFDYVEGLKNADWARQILFVKGGAAAAPDYFVIDDSLKTPQAAVWRLWLTAKKITLHPQQVTVEGKDGVDLDIFFLRPAEVNLSLTDKTWSTWGITEGKYGKVDTTQTAVVARLKPGENVTAVLYPRLQSEPPPAFMTVAGGKGVKIVNGEGIDTVFLDRGRFSYDGGDVAFNGSVGVIERRDGQSRLWLGAAGSLAAGGRQLSHP